MSDLGREPPVAARKRGLGMGLSALLGTGADATHAPPGAVPKVPIEFLRPSALQPRRQFAQDDLEALAASIRAKGIMQPLVVRPEKDREGHYEIVAGERRWRAAQLAGCHELPVVVHDLPDRDALEVALLENVQRQDLTPLEEAEGYRRLIDEFGHTQDGLARSIGKSRSHIANLIRLLGLPTAVRENVERRELSAGHARALLGARDPVAAGRIVIERGLNVRQTEALVRADAQATAPRGNESLRDANTEALERDLSRRLGLPVTVVPSRRGGKVSIAYRSLDQLDGLIRRLS